MRFGLAASVAMNSMSPRPSSFSAPAPSMIVRESTCEDTAKAMRVGKLALIRPVMTSTDGRCVATIRWMPVARASWARRQIWRSTSYGAAIIRSASSSMITTQYGSLCAGARALVVGLDVAHADLGEAAVAAVHLVDDRLQRAHDLVHIDDDLGERQVRDARSYVVSSTRFGSMRTRRSSSGVLCSSRPAMIELMQTLLPLPVAPAISRCGIFAEVRRDRLARDALAQRQRQLRLADSPSGRPCSRSRCACDTATSSCSAPRCRRSACRAPAPRCGSSAPPGPAPGRSPAP